MLQFLFSHVLSMLISIIYITIVPPSNAGSTTSLGVANSLVNQQTNTNFQIASLQQQQLQGHLQNPQIVALPRNIVTSTVPQQQPHSQIVHVVSQNSPGNFQPNIGSLNRPRYHAIVTHSNQNQIQTQLKPAIYNDNIVSFPHSIQSSTPTRVCLGVYLNSETGIK